MTFFVYACLSVMAAAIVLEMASEEGVLTVSPKVWYAVLAVMAVRLLLLA